MGSEITRALASIRSIDSIIKHPNADTLDLLKIGGWQVVSKHGNFKEGDLCVFFEIDSFVPVTGIFSFLEKSKITYKGKEGARIKTIRLRKELSQGLALPINDLFNGTGDLAWDLFDGTDVTEVLGIIKWEKMTEEERAKLGGTALGYFPSFIPKTDQERIQNIWGSFGLSTDRIFSEYTNPETNEVIKVERKPRYFKDQLFEVTTKLDGSSLTVYLRDDHFGVCSRNLELAESETNAFWQIARKLKLEERLRQYGKNIALQGELVGPGIQGNNDRLTDIDFYLFDIWDIDNQCYYITSERNILVRLFNGDRYCSEGTPRLNHAPTLGYFTLTKTLNSLDEILKYADGESLTPGTKREGIVFKSMDNPSFSFKAISNKYLESEK